MPANCRAYHLLQKWFTFFEGSLFDMEFRCLDSSKIAKRKMYEFIERNCAVLKRESYRAIDGLSEIKWVLLKIFSWLTRLEDCSSDRELRL